MMRACFVNTARVTGDRFEMPGHYETGVQIRRASLQCCARGSQERHRCVRPSGRVPSRRRSRNLDQAVGQLATMDPTWGVVGVFGVTRATEPEYRGHCYSTGLRAVLGKSFSEPIEAQSLDELVLVVRRSSGLSFDGELPGFHLYGTDICLRAATKGLRTYIVPAFCVHNSNGVKYYPVEFSARLLPPPEKWWPQLPIITCCTTITKWCLPAIKSMSRDCVDTVFRLRNVGSRVNDVATLYRSLSLTL